MSDGLAAELLDMESLLRAARAMRARGYTRLDACTPYGPKELDDALGLPRSRLPRFVLGGAVLGACAGFAIMTYTQVFAYPLDVGGHALFPIPALIPNTFESGVLAAALTAFVVSLLLGRLPRLHHPLFEVPRFERSSIDRFWLVVSADDARFDRERTAAELEQLGAARVAPFGSLADGEADAGEPAPEPEPAHEEGTP